MNKYLVELYQSRHAHRNAKDLSLETAPIRCLRSIFVPGDEICLLLCEALSSTALAEELERVGIEFERVVEAEARIP